MKKYIAVLFALLLIPVFLYADIDTKDGVAITEDTDMDGFTGTIGGTDGGGAPAAGGESCTGTTTFIFYAENSDTVTVGGGCSVGDTVGARNDSATYDGAIYSTLSGDGGTYSLDAADRYKYIQFDNDVVGTEDLLEDTAGTIVFDLYITTFLAAGRIFRVGEDTGGNTDQLMIYLFGTNEMGASYNGNSTDVFVEMGGESDPDLSLDTWYTVTVKWRLTGSPNLSINVNGKTKTSDTELTALEHPWEWVRFGECGQNDSDVHIDNVKFYKEWL